MDKYDWVIEIMNIIDEIILEDEDLENKDIKDEYSYIKGKNEAMYSFSKKFGKLIKNKFQ